MANIKSQIKRNRQNDAAHERNKSVKSALKTAVRKFREAADAGDADAGQDARRRAPAASSTRPPPRASSTRTRPRTGSRRSTSGPRRSDAHASHEAPLPRESAPRAAFRPRDGRRQRPRCAPVMVSTIRSREYAASPAAPLTSASARATAGIAVGQAEVVPAAGLLAQRPELPRRHPDLAGQVGLAQPARAPT